MQDSKLQLITVPLLIRLLSEASRNIMQYFKRLILKPFSNTANICGGKKGYPCLE